MLTRRRFLASSSLVALAPTVPAFLAQTALAAAPAKDSRILVVIQLDGGNDGINTVVPFADPGYEKSRKQLRLAKQQLVKINDKLGFHQAMGDVGKLFDAGRLAVIQGVGYPNPNRSHFESMAIWHSARTAKENRPAAGWLGLGLDEGPKTKGGGPVAVYVGAGTLPQAIRGRKSIVSGLTRPEDFVLDPEADPRPAAPDKGDGEDLSAFVRRVAADALGTADRMANVARGKDDGARYPSSELAGHLKLIAKMIKADTGTRVFYARQGGYDTHAAQFGSHFRLLTDLSAALKALIDDLAAAKVADRVCVLTFSEFGRTVKENSSQGTDHGTAGPVCLAGGALKGGLVGETPSLTDLDPKHGDLKTNYDFRRVYAAVLDNWLNLKSKSALGGEYEPLELFKV
jgi:uncharacterized protein (DUF1501 family)